MNNVRRKRDSGKKEGIRWVRISLKEPETDAEVALVTVYLHAA